MYIDNQRLIKLLEQYPSLEHRIEILILDLQRLVNNHSDFDEQIYSLIIGNKGLDGMPFPAAGNTSDKTGNVAISYLSILENRENEAVKEVIEDLITIQAVKKKMDIAFNSLLKEMREVVFYKCCEVKPWKEICKELHIDRRKGQHLKKVGLERLCKMIRIDTKEYQKVVMDAQE